MQRTETNRIEYKQELTEELDLEKEVIAFLNYHEGGIISIKNILSPRKDLTFSQLRIYYEEKGLRLNDNFLRSLELLTDDGQLNYAAYLLADENGNSMKLAKYAGNDRYELISNNEYGYCCLLTATQKVLDKLDVENKVSTVITPTGRHDTPQWNKIAIREALINAVVHNDYSYGAPSKVELFSDHLEITSIGRIPDGLSKEDFFNGVSLPRNKELMRVFRDVEMVEALGSGMLRIMRTYGRENFEFGDNFIRFKVKYGDLGHDTENVLESQGDVRKDVRKELTERQSIIMDLIKENVRIGIEEMSVKMSVNEKTVRRDINILKQRGLLTRIGGRKNGCWQLVDQHNTEN